MPFDFNKNSEEFDSQVDENVEPELQNVQGVINSLDSNFEEEELNDDLTEIEKRLEVASYYNCLLKDSVFGADPSHAARVVTYRIKKFVKGELSELVGLTLPKSVASVQPLFSDAEIAALKALAAKVIGRPSVMDGPLTKGPVLNTVVKPNPSHTLPVARPNIPTLKHVATPKTSVAGQDSLGIKQQMTGARQLVKKQTNTNGKKRFVEIPHPMVSGETILKDVSSQSQPTGALKPLPMPQGTQMTMVTEQQAQLNIANPGIANADRSDASQVKNQISAAISLSLK